MNYNDWKDKTVSFKKIDVRGVQGNFFPGLKMQAAKMAVGEGMEIIHPDLKPFKDATSDVIDKFSVSYGVDLIDMIGEIQNGN